MMRMMIRTDHKDASIRGRYSLDFFSDLLDLPDLCLIPIMVSSSPKFISIHPLLRGPKCVEISSERQVASRHDLLVAPINYALPAPNPSTRQAYVPKT